MGKDPNTDRGITADRRPDLRRGAATFGDPAKRNLGYLLTIVGVVALTIGALMIVRATSVVGRSASEARSAARETSESQREAQATIARLNAELATLKRQQDLLLSLGGLTGRISEPFVGAVVSKSAPIRVKGNLGPVPSGYAAWLVVRRAPTGLAWPKEPRVLPGDFDTEIFEGGPSGEIHLDLVVVDAAIDAEIAAWVTEGKRTKRWDGIDLNRSQVRRVHSIKLVTRD